jgi:hypothetical protein
LSTNFKIYSAVYGLETKEDIDVTDKIRSATGDALAIRVDNDLVPKDPAKGDTKRLEVEYSYATRERKTISRSEGELMVLPEDPHMQNEILALKSRVQNEIQKSNQFVTQLASQREAEVEMAARHQREIAVLKEQLSAIYPFVVPVNFGPQDKPEKQARWPGLLLSNDGKRVAYDVAMVPLKIGRWSVNLDKVLRLEAGDKIPTFLDVWHETTGDADLRRHILELQQANGTVGDPIPFKIIYRDADQNWFASLCEFQFSVSSGLGVRCSKRQSHIPS